MYPGEPSAHGYRRRRPAPHRPPARGRGGVPALDRARPRLRVGTSGARRPAARRAPARGRRGRARVPGAHAAGAGAADPRRARRGAGGRRRGELRGAARGGGRRRRPRRRGRDAFVEAKATAELRAAFEAALASPTRAGRRGLAVHRVAGLATRTGAAATRSSPAWRKRGPRCARPLSPATCAALRTAGDKRRLARLAKQHRSALALRRLPLEPHRARDLARRRPRARSSGCRTGRSARRARGRSTASPSRCAACAAPRRRCASAAARSSSPPITSRRATGPGWGSRRRSTESLAEAESLARRASSRPRSRRLSTTPSSCWRAPRSSIRRSGGAAFDEAKAAASSRRTASPAATTGTPAPLRRRTVDLVVRERGGLAVWLWRFLDTG